MIEIKDTGFYYEEKSPVLKGVNLKIEAGEFVVLLGGSGCGKSTLLSLIAGLRKPREGRIEIDGQEVKKPDEKIGILFQSDSLFPWMSVEKNIRFGIRQAFRGKKREWIRNRAEDYLALVGLKEHGSKYPGQLSGGMRQRAALARLMAMDKEIWLLDEPFSSLDPKIRLELSELLEVLWQAGGEAGKKKTILFVTHDVDEAILLADRIQYMGKNRIEAEITIPFRRPRGVDTIFEEERYCTIRKQVIDLYYRSDQSNHPMQKEQSEQEEQAEGGTGHENKASGTSAGNFASCACGSSGRA